jgi:Fe-S cluster biosynthesis and repair protein YggX
MPEVATPTAARLVRCVKLGQELPGVERKPFKSELGERIFAQVSQQAWKMWTDHAKLILNEYRLNLAMPECQEFLMKQCEAFFFGEGAHVPKEFMPAGHAHEHEHDHGHDHGHGGGGCCGGHGHGH